MTAAALAVAPPMPFRRPVAPSSALDALLRSGTIDARRHAAAVAYRDVRARHEAARRSAGRSGPRLSLPEAAWFALKRRHDAVLDAAGFDRFLLDRLLLDDDAPLRCEVERVGEALGRVAAWATAAHA